MANGAAFQQLFKMVISSTKIITKIESAKKSTEVWKLENKNMPGIFIKPEAGKK
jgi:hypothetical protein